jgi:hypothetical protein
MICHKECGLKDIFNKDHGAELSQLVGAELIPSHSSSHLYL